MLIKVIKPDFVFEDERGCLAQLVHGGYKQINSVFTKKGAVRGNFHYHAETEEAFYVAGGKIKVTAVFESEKEEKEFSSGDMFLIPKNVKHCFDFIEDTFLVVLYTEPVEKDDGSKDIIGD